MLLTVVQDLAGSDALEAELAGADIQLSLRGVGDLLDLPAEALASSSAASSSDGWQQVLQQGAERLAAYAATGAPISETAVRSVAMAQQQRHSRTPAWHDLVSALQQQVFLVRGSILPLAKQTGLLSAMA